MMKKCIFFVFVLLILGYADKGVAQVKTANFDWTYNSTDFGERVGGNSDVWWCGAAYKVGMYRKVPDKSHTSKTVSVSLAKNEYEAVQVVVNAPMDIKNVTIKVSPLIREGGREQLPAANINIEKVDYVRTAQTSDTSTITGLWPDPLMPIEGSLNLEANRNHPFWVTIYAPKNLVGGTYRGELLFSGDGWNRKVPIEVKVWDFALSDERHLKTAMGLSLSDISKYHNVTGKDLEKVVDMYYENLSQHRISPYDPTYGAAIHVDWGISEGQAPGQVSSGQVKVDFSDFDRAMEKSIDRYHFNSIRIPLMGVGWNGYAGTMYYPGIIGPYTQGTDQYNLLLGSYLKQLQDHLSKKGWLDIAYIYWYDEPKFLVYQEIREMGELIKRYAPRLKWLLTEKITLDLAGPVDIWCPQIDNYNRDTSLIALAAGYKLWWYICTVPKAPYVGEFIDHAAIEPRLWLWQTWKNNVQGILIWRINYWTTTSAYPNSLQNPWTDAESWVNGSPGKRWGNGDGRFLYPPNKDPNRNKKPILSGPVNSTRWELLRDGIEDYEYFWTLRNQLGRFSIINANQELSPKERNWVKDAEKLLLVPDHISKSLTEFSKNPLALMQHRSKVAEAIQQGEQLLKSHKDRSH